MRMAWKNNGTERHAFCLGKQKDVCTYVCELPDSFNMWSAAKQLASQPDK